jgi:hypothetical protein
MCADTYGPFAWFMLAVGTLFLIMNQRADEVQGIGSKWTLHDTSYPMPDSYSQIIF